ATAPPITATSQPTTPALSATSNQKPALCFTLSGHILFGAVRSRCPLRRRLRRRARLAEDRLRAAAPRHPLVHLEHLARLGVPRKVLHRALIGVARMPQPQ